LPLNIWTTYGRDAGPRSSTIAIEHHDVPINPGYGAMKAAMIKGVDV